jgi:hypothetical protein
MRAPRRASVPEGLRVDLVTRLERHASRKWKRECREVVVRFRGPHAYVDAFPAKQSYPPGATKAEKAEIDATPVHLCRLEYLGQSKQWGFAFFKYSDEKYETAILPSGSFTGTLEECFDCAAMVYLQNW